MTYLAHETVHISLVCPAQAARLCLFYYTILELAAPHCCVLKPHLMTTCTAFLSPNLGQGWRRGAGSLVVNWSGEHCGGVGAKIRAQPAMHWQSLMEPSSVIKPEFEPLYKRQCRQSLSQFFFIIPQFKVVSTVSDVSNSGLRAASKCSGSAQSIGRWDCLGRPYIVPWKTVSIEAQMEFIPTVLEKGAQKTLTKPQNHNTDVQK